MLIFVIREVVETAKSEFIAKLDELISKNKVRMIANGSSNKKSNTNNNNTPTDTTKSATTTTDQSISSNDTENKVSSNEECESSSLLDDVVDNVDDADTVSANAMADGSSEVCLDIYLKINWVLIVFRLSVRRKATRI